MNCKPGDLAIIIAANFPETAANVGSIVEVLRAHPIRGAGGALTWIVESKGRLLLGFHPCARDGVIAARQVGVLDSNLRPLRGDETPESIAITIPENEGAPAWA